MSFALSDTILQGGGGWEELGPLCGGSWGEELIEHQVTAGKLLRRLVKGVTMNFLLQMASPECSKEPWT